MAWVQALRERSSMDTSILRPSVSPYFCEFLLEHTVKPSSEKQLPRVRATASWRPSELVIPSRRDPAPQWKKWWPKNQPRSCSCRSGSLALEARAQVR
jgi:hypothetical protein